MSMGNTDEVANRRQYHVALVGPATSIHIQRWASGLSEHGLKVSVVTQHSEGALPLPAAIDLHVMPFKGNAGYFLNAFALWRILRRIRPDIVNAHYASGYGTTAALAGYKPTLLSVWGSDVFSFPYEGRLKGWLVRRNLRCADAVASTSGVMAQQVRQLLPSVGSITVTPFGIDTSVFTPRPSPHDGFVIGAVKTLAPKYGIDVLIKAFARIHEAGRELSLVIVGDGPERESLENLAASLGISDHVRFIGAVPHDQVPQWLNGFDVYVACSRFESFGVAVLEASACGVAVIVSDVGGLPEVVRDWETGIVVPHDDEAALAEAVNALIASPSMRRTMGRAGRAHVVRQYQWDACVDRMIACYTGVIARHTPRK
jgi:L-malate glycosyltransferase